MAGLILAALAAVLASAGCDSSRTVPSGDAQPDARPDSRAVHDLARTESFPRDAASDMNLRFPAMLEGVWLVGWSGGMNHFSWVRFARMETPTMQKKDAWILDGKSIFANVPLWDCNGKATYWMGAAAQTIYIDFPSTSCLPGGHASMGYVFGDPTAPGASAPKAAILEASVKDQPTLKPLMGYKFPDTWCDATMTTCKAPF